MGHPSSSQRVVGFLHWPEILLPPGIDGGCDGAVLVAHLATPGRQ